MAPKAAPALKVGAAKKAKDASPSNRDAPQSSTRKKKKTSPVKKAKKPAVEAIAEEVEEPAGEPAPVRPSGPPDAAADQPEELAPVGAEASVAGVSVGVVGMDVEAAALVATQEPEEEQEEGEAAEANKKAVAAVISAAGAAAIAAIAAEAAAAQAQPTAEPLPSQVASQLPSQVASQLEAEEAAEAEVPPAAPAPTPAALPAAPSAAPAPAASQSDEIAELRMLIDSGQPSARRKEAAVSAAVRQHIVAMLGKAPERAAREREAAAAGEDVLAGASVPASAPTATSAGIRTADPPIAPTPSPAMESLVTLAAPAAELPTEMPTALAASPPAEEPAPPAAEPPAEPPAAPVAEPPAAPAPPPADPAAPAAAAPTEAPASTSKAPPMITDLPEALVADFASAPSLADAPSVVSQFSDAFLTEFASAPGATEPAVVPAAVSVAVSAAVSAEEEPTAAPVAAPTAAPAAVGAAVAVVELAAAEPAAGEPAAAEGTIAPNAAPVAALVATPVVEPVAEPLPEPEVALVTDPASEPAPAEPATAPAAASEEPKELTPDAAKTEVAESPTPDQAQRPPPAQKRYAAFLSHYKDETAMEARFLHIELQAVIGRDIFIDSVSARGAPTLRALSSPPTLLTTICVWLPLLPQDDLHDLQRLKEAVIQSDVLLLVQSKRVLERPWCLIEMMTALENGIPIVGVSLATGGDAYNHTDAAAFLADLDKQLEVRNPGATDLLKENGIDVLDVVWKLSSTLPGIISTFFNPKASKNVLNAVIMDIAASIRRAQPCIIPPSEKWLAARAAKLTLAVTTTAVSAVVSSHRASHRAQAVTEPTAVDTSFKTKSLATIPPDVPELPIGLQTRPILHDELKAQVLKQAGMVSVVGMQKTAATTAAHGMGGVGKTTAAVQLIRDKEVGAAFSKLLWVSVSAEPDNMYLLDRLHNQLTGEKLPAKASGSEMDAVQEVEKAAKGIRALLILDDCWEGKHAQILNVVDADAGSACVITTRIRSLAESEISCGLLSVEESLSLLLTTAGLPHLIASPPQAAIEAVECCSRLALALPIAGSMIRQLPDVWEDELVPMLREELAEELSVESRIVNASFRVIQTDQRAGVEALFIVFGAFAEDEVVPVAALDALAPIICMRAGMESVSNPHLKVRKWLSALLKASLLSGSLERGVAAHDLVRDVMMSRAEATRDGMVGLQRLVLARFLTAYDDAAALAAETLQSLARARQKSNRSLSPVGPIKRVVKKQAIVRRFQSPAMRVTRLNQAFITRSLRHHVPNARQPDVSLHADELILKVLNNTVSAIRTEAVVGIGMEQMKADIETAEAAECWFIAAQMWYAAATVQIIRAGAELQRAWAAIKQVQETPESKALELYVLKNLMFVTEGGFKFGSPEHDEISARIAAISATSTDNSPNGKYDKAFGEALVAIFNGHNLMGITKYIEPPSDHPQAYAHYNEAFVACGRAAENDVSAAKRDLALQVETMMSWIAILHTIPEFDKAEYGVGLCARARDNIMRYDFDILHAAHKSEGVSIDIFLFAHNEAHLLWWEGDMKTAKIGWAKQIDAWQQISALIKEGDRQVNEYALYEDVVGVGALAAVMLAAGELDLLRELHPHTARGIALRDPEVAAAWEAAFQGAPWYWDGPGGHRMYYTSTLMLQARAIAAIVDDSGETDADALRVWLPQPKEAITIAQKERCWNVMIFGAAHPSLLCATLYADRLGAFDEAAEIAEALIAIPSVDMTPQVTMEAHRLLARCHGARGENTAACETLERALAISKAVGYVWYDVLILRDMLKWMSSDEEVAAKRAEIDVLAVGFTE